MHPSRSNFLDLSAPQSGRSIFGSLLGFFMCLGGIERNSTGITGECVLSGPVLRSSANRESYRKQLLVLQGAGNLRISASCCVLDKAEKTKGYAPNRMLKLMSTHSKLLVLNRANLVLNTAHEPDAISRSSANSIQAECSATALAGLHLHLVVLLL